jgi:predicted AAA+ superfamily ATPase
LAGPRLSRVDVLFGADGAGAAGAVAVVVAVIAAGTVVVVTDPDELPQAAKAVTAMARTMRRFIMLAPDDPGFKLLRFDAFSTGEGASEARRAGSYSA